MRSHHWVSLSLCFWKMYSLMYFHTLLLQSPSRLPPVEQRPNCLVNEVLDGLRLSVIAQIRLRHWDWGHRLRSKWPTSNTIWPGSAACAQPGDSCALRVLSGINWLQRWTELRLTPDMCGVMRPDSIRVNHASVYQGISQINWTLWQFANNNETETRTQQQAKCWQKLLNYFSFKYFMMVDSQIFLGVLCVVIIETFLTWLLMIDRDRLV